MIKRIVLILALLLIFFCIWCLPYDLTERESLEKAYAKGRDNFYAALKKMATNARLEETDRKKILNAQKRISGLYEHLMNFYYFTKQGDRAKDDISGHIKALTDRLAEEFVNSIPSRRWTKDTLKNWRVSKKSPWKPGNERSKNSGQKPSKPQKFLSSSTGMLRVHSGVGSYLLSAETVCTKKRLS
jgi:hypothetical protein